MRVSKSGVHDRKRARRDMIDASTSSAVVLESLRAALGSQTGSAAVAYERAMRLLEAAEGVRTNDACLVLEIEKPCPEEPAPAEPPRRLARA